MSTLIHKPMRMSGNLGSRYNKVSFPFRFQLGLEKKGNVCDSTETARHASVAPITMESVIIVHLFRVEKRIEGRGLDFIVPGNGGRGWVTVPVKDFPPSSTRKNIEKVALDLDCYFYRPFFFLRLRSQC